MRPELDRNLILVRSAEEYQRLDSLDLSSEPALVNETDVAAFDNGAEEWCVLPVARSLGMLITPTCDLGQDYWLFSPLRSTGTNSQINRDTLFSTTKGYGDLFGIYVHPQHLFEESFISFHDVYSVPSEPYRFFGGGVRIANLSKQAQDFLADKSARFLGRGWGYAPTESVEQAGYYRCRTCSRYYGLGDTVIFLKEGDNPPTCKNCSAIGQKGSWELLLKHKNSKKP